MLTVAEVAARISAEEADVRAALDEDLAGKSVGPNGEVLVEEAELARWIDSQGVRYVGLDEQARARLCAELAAADAAEFGPEA